MRLQSNTLGPAGTPQQIGGLHNICMDARQSKKWDNKLQEMFLFF